MKSELQGQLYAKYPALFAQKDVSASKTCMCWGITCGDGWYNLLDALCAKLKAYAEENTVRIEFAQVKEKFGQLRCYVDILDQQGQWVLRDHFENVHELLDDAERESASTCEFCGATESVTTTSGGWLRNLCPPCHEFNNSRRTIHVDENDKIVPTE